jgi:hypothetical protein
MIYDRKIAFKVMFWWLQRKRRKQQLKAEEEIRCALVRRALFPRVLAKMKKSRRSKGKSINKGRFIDSLWWKMLQNTEALNDPTSPEARLFRALIHCISRFLPAVAIKRCFLKINRIVLVLLLFLWSSNYLAFYECWVEEIALMISRN